MSSNLGHIADATATAISPSLGSRRTKAVDPLARASKEHIQTLTMTSVGIEMGLCVMIGLLFGRWLDGQVGTSPLLMFVFLGFGCAAAAKAVWRAVKTADRIADESPAQEKA